MATAVQIAVIAKQIANILHSNGREPHFRNSIVGIKDDK